MHDLKAYWRGVRALEQNLPPYVWVIHSKGGAPVEVSGANAARLIQGKSHRLATEDEIRARQESETARSRQDAREDLRRRGIAVVPVRE